jgi:DHA1 family tetracycline resistance protein-like MFS transporter
MRHPEYPTARALRLLFCILLLDVIGLSMLFPIAVYLVRPYSSDALMVTLMTVIYAGAQFLTSPILGKLGDRYGRRPVLLVSIFGASIGYLILGIGGALWVLFLSRLIGGIAASNQSVAAAVIADLSMPETRAKNFTLIGLAWGIGLVIGPALGGVFAQISLAAPAYLAASLALARVTLA